MASENATLNATEALRPLRNEVGNFFLFEDEVKTAPTSIFEKHCVGQSSLKRAKMSRIPASAVLEGEVKMWLKMLHRRLSPRMKARSAWTVEFKRAMSSEIFSLIFQNVKKARSAYGVSYKEEKHTGVIYYHRENRLIRDFAKLSELSSDSVREFLMKKSKGTSKGTSKVSISSETPFTITSIKRTQQVVVKAHYKFTNEFGYTFS